MLGSIRNMPMFDTYEAIFYLNSYNEVIGLKSNDINNGNIFGTESSRRIKLYVGNVIKGIIESSGKKKLYDLYNGEIQYGSEEEFIRELNIAYKARIRILLEN